MQQTVLSVNEDEQLLFLHYWHLLSSTGNSICIRKWQHKLLGIILQQQCNTVLFIINEDIVLYCIVLYLFIIVTCNLHFHNHAQVHVQSTLSYQATVMRGQPVMKGHIATVNFKKPSCEDGSHYNYCQLNLIMPLWLEANLWRWAIIWLSAHIRPLWWEDSLIRWATLWLLSTLSYYATVMRGQPVKIGHTLTVSSVISGHCDEANLWRLATVYQLSYYVTVMRGQPVKMGHTLTANSSISCQCDERPTCEDGSHYNYTDLD